MPGGQRGKTAEQTPVSYEELISIGKAFADANDAPKARDAFGAALELEPHQLEPRLWLCRLAYKAFDWKDLHERGGAYLADWPDDRELLLLYARGCNGVADWPAAMAAWRQVSENRPEWPEARFQHARAEIRLGQHSAASQIADELGSMPDGGVYAVRLRVELNEFAAAKAGLEALFRSDPALAVRELDLLDQQKNQRGLAAGLRARLDAEGDAAVDPDTLLTVSETLFRRAIAYERAGDLLEAFFDYEALLVLAPDDDLAKRSSARIVRALRDLAQAHLAQEALPEAAEAFARVVRAAPADIHLRRSYGRVLMRLREWSKAATVWRELVGAVPDDLEGAVQLARAFDRSGRYPEAIVAWRAVQARAPEHDEAQAGLSTIIRRMMTAGRLAITEERFLEAYELFRTVQREDPKDEEAPRRLEQVGRNLRKVMRAAYKARDLRGVIASGAAATDLLPDDPEVQLLIGRAAVGLRRYETALTSWLKLRELDPAQATIADLQVARCYLHLGDAEKGQAATRKILVADPKNPEARQLLEQFRSLG